MEALTLIKAGGMAVDDATMLTRLLADFAAIRGYKALVHGGGRTASHLAKRLHIDCQMRNGRRITDLPMLEVAIMVYAGLVNKQIVAKLQALHVNALGLTGADMNILRADRRPPTPETDFGFVGDIKEVNVDALAWLFRQGISPVLAPLSHDGHGQLLNTNADSIAGESAKALAKYFNVTLIFCSDKQGVLANENDPNSLISSLDFLAYQRFAEQGVINEGMLPKLDNAFAALRAGVKNVVIARADDIVGASGTRLNL